MSIEILAEPQSIAIRLTGWDGLLAGRRRLDIPAKAIAGAAAIPRDQVAPPRAVLTNMGSYLPGLLYYGRFGIGPAREFWAARRQPALVVINCRDWRYTRVVLGVPEPELAAGTVRLVIGGR